MAAEGDNDRLLSFEELLYNIGGIQKSQNTGSRQDENKEQLKRNIGWTSMLRPNLLIARPLLASITSAPKRADRPQKRS